MTESTVQRWTPPREPADVDDALWIFQADLPVLKKDRDGQVGNQLTKYADLTQANEVVLTRLNALGCLWTCSPRMISLGDQLRFVLAWELKHVPSGTSRTGDFPVVGDNPMKLGSGITYARRYSLLAVTGVIPEDEDDDGAGGDEAGHAVARRRAASGRAVQRGQRPAAAPATSRPARPGPPLPGEDEVPEPERRAQAAAARGEQAGPPPSGEHDPGSVEQRQMKRMHALWGELVKLGQTQFEGDAGRDERLKATARLAGRAALDTSSDLTFAEANTVIDKLAARRDQLSKPPEVM